MSQAPQLYYTGIIQTSVNCNNNSDSLCHSNEGSNFFSVNASISGCLYLLRDMRAYSFG